MTREFGMKKSISKIESEIKKFKVSDEEFGQLLSEFNSRIDEDYTGIYFKISNNIKLQETAEELKIPKNSILGFDFLSGYTCRAAKDCLVWAEYNKSTGKAKLRKGPDWKFNCYSGRDEARMPVVYNARLYNTKLIQTFNNDIVEMALAIYHSLMNKNKRMKIVRFLSAGGMISTPFYYATLLVAQVLPDVDFFGYTKILPYLLDEFKNLWPDNYSLAYSFGGLYDTQAMTEFRNKKITACFVIKDIHSAVHNLPVACQKNNSRGDYLFIMARQSFCLVLH